MTELRMRAYYYSFRRTGIELVDRVLSAVACAGKAYHHTDGWTDDIEEPYEECFRGSCCVDWIQNAADDAAAEIKHLHERLGPRGLEVVEIDGAGHYVNEKVKAEIERLREENRHFRAATVAAMTTSTVSSKDAS